MKSGLKVLVGVVLGLGIAGGVGYAVTGGVIRACYANGNKALRFLASGHCNGNETEISWNSVGAAGPAGPPGPAGAPGLPGLKAHARIFTDGTPSPESSPNVTAANVVHPGPGKYCFYFNDFVVSNVVASLELGSAPALILVVPKQIVSEAARFCPGTESASVRLLDLRNDFQDVDGNFDVVFN
jgi:hypothetical protein